jgi:hypothetical protein
VCLGDAIVPEKNVGALNIAVYYRLVSGVEVVETLEYVARVLARQLF